MMLFAVLRDSGQYDGIGTRIALMRKEDCPPVVRLWRHVTGVVNATDDSC